MTNHSSCEDKVNHFILSFGRAKERYDFFYYSREARTMNEFVNEVNAAIKLAAELSVSQKLTLNSDFDLLDSASKLLPDRGFSRIHPFYVYLELYFDEADPSIEKRKVEYKHKRKEDLTASLYIIDYTHPCYLDFPERFIFSFEGRNEVLCDLIDYHVNLSNGVEEILDTLLKIGCKNIPFHEVIAGCRHHEISLQYKECLGDELFEKVNKKTEDHDFQADPDGMPF